MSPFFAIAWVLISLGCLMGAVRYLASQSGMSAELSRKCVHIVMGLITLTFPWLFHEFWPVFVLGLVSVILLSAVRTVGFLKKSIGTVLGGVERASLGDVYFPVSVTLLFWLSQGDPIFYCIPILILTLADAMSALIGVQYGQNKYSTSEGTKSIEGSVAFFTVAFLGTHLPLLLASSVGRLESVLIAMMMGLLLMMLEAVALAGLDNILVPVGAFLFLKLYLVMPVSDLLHRLLLLLPLFVLMFVLRQRSELKGSSLLLSTLCLYAFWALGGVSWLMPPLLVFLLYPFVLSKRPESPELFGLTAVTTTVATGFFWLLLSKVFFVPQGLLASAVAFAAHFAIIMASNRLALNPDRSVFKEGALAIFLAWLMLMLPFLVITNLLTYPVLLFSFLVIATTMTAFLLTQKELSDHVLNKKRWAYRGLIVFLGSLLVLWI
ncbi:MAG: hypothetical protein K2X01_10455 [Cyanobacteria bacterium]|nr:hypothetical protein [Cyanobacteriota bacterium]